MLSLAPKLPVTAAAVSTNQGSVRGYGHQDLERWPIGLSFGVDRRGPAWRRPPRVSKSIVCRSPASKVSRRAGSRSRRSPGGTTARCRRRQPPVMRPGRTTAPTGAAAPIPGGCAVAPAGAGPRGRKTITGGRCRRQGAVVPPGMRRRPSKLSTGIGPSPSGTAMGLRTDQNAGVNDDRQTSGHRSGHEKHKRHRKRNAGVNPPNRLFCVVCVFRGSNSPARLLPSEPGPAVGFGAPVRGSGRSLGCRRHLGSTERLEIWFQSRAKWIERHGVLCGQGVVLCG